MSTITDIGTLIVLTPETCGGRPRIPPTRVSVQNIAIDQEAGMSPEEIAAQRMHLTLAQIYAALAYYHSNKEEIDADIAAYYAECEHLEAESIAGKLKWAELVGIWMKMWLNVAWWRLCGILI